MILPDLEKELGFWRERLRLGGWQIAMRYEDDPRDPATGAAVDGLCTRVPDNQIAEIVIRTPTSDAELANAHDSIIHELLHVRLALMDGSVVAEENVVWPLAALLTDLRLNAPAKATALCKALSRNRTLLAAQTRARAGERYKMDPQQLAQLAMEAGQLITQEGLSEQVKTLLQQLIALAAGGSAPLAPEAESMSPKEEDKPEAPPMGMQKQDAKPYTKATDAEALLKSLQAALGGASGDGARLKAMEETMASDRAAAVDGLLDTRPDLTMKQRGRLRELGLAQGVARVREDLAELIPPPAVAGKPAEQTRAKLGLEAPPRRGGGKAGFRPSGNPDMMMRLRVSAEPDEEISAPGCTLFDETQRQETGKLMEMSIWKALPALRKASQADVQRRAKRIGGEA